ncbi:MAG: hypothetical protein D6698_14420, partial [Gammaproteobacteria bacterium]
MTKLLAAGEHVFQRQRFAREGENNPMHRTSSFWQDPERVSAYKQKQRDRLSTERARQMQRQSTRTRLMNTAWRLINAGYEIPTFDHYIRAYCEEICRLSSEAVQQRQASFQALFGSYAGFLKELDRHNHTVVSIEYIGDMDVYSVEVECPTPDDKTPDSGHTYLIWPNENDSPIGTGIFVFNTRRAAIMQTLHCDHPDIRQFITAKKEEEKKAWALIEQGYDGSFNGPAYGSVAFQNVNQSVRVTDAFMHAATSKTTEGRYWPLLSPKTGKRLDEDDANDLLRLVAEGTWICGDPGLQFHDRLNQYNKVPNVGEHRSTNPCVTGDTLVATEEGLRRIDSMVGETPRVVGLDGRIHRTTRVIETGTKPVYRLRTQSGYTVKLTADHR